MRTVYALCVLLASATFTVLKAQTNAVKYCPPDTVVDLFFLVDSSGSISTNDYKYNFQFIQKIVDGYYIGEDGAKVALLTFSTSVNPKFNLSGDPAFIREQLLNVTFQKQLTNTHKALAYILDEGWNTPAKGARNGRQVVILITDGVSRDQEKTKKEAARIKNAGITIIVVGVGSGIKLAEIRAVASKPEYALTVSKYSALNNIANKTADIACRPETPEPTTQTPEPTTETPQITAKTPEPTTQTPEPTTQTPEPTTVPIRPSPVISCPSPRFNLQFWVDSSDIVDVKDYKYNFQFIQTIIDAFNVGRYGARVDLYTFGSDVVDVFSENENPDAIRESLQNVAYVGGSTNTHVALSQAFTNSLFFRGNDTQIIILITGGKSAKPAETLEEAYWIKRLNKTTNIVVGVSNFVDLNEIRAIASKPEYAITVNNYAELYSVANKTVEIVCNEEKRLLQT